MYNGIKKAYYLVQRIETLSSMYRMLEEYRAQLCVANLTLELSSTEDIAALRELIDSEIVRLRKQLKEVPLDD